MSPGMKDKIEAFANSLDEDVVILCATRNGAAGFNASKCGLIDLVILHSRLQRAFNDMRSGIRTSIEEAMRPSALEVFDKGVEEFSKEEQSDSVVYRRIVPRS